MSVGGAATTCWRDFRCACLQAVRWPFILYGDSLTEVWEGTRGCKKYAPRSGFDALRKRYLSPLSKADGMSGAGRAWVNACWHPMHVKSACGRGCGLTLAQARSLD